MDEEGHSSTSSYEYVEPLLKERARELLIISPYIGHRYARMLVELGKRKKVRVITSGSAAWLDGYSYRYSRSLLFRRAGILAVLLVLSIFFLYLGPVRVGGIAFILFLIVLALSWIRFRRARSSDIKVKVVRSTFIHEKVYISDNKAVIGSANLTYPGMHSNMEHVEIINQKRRIEELRRHFHKLWKND